MRGKADRLAARLLRGEPKILRAAMAAFTTVDGMARTLAGGAVDFLPRSPGEELHEVKRRGPRECHFRLISFASPPVNGGGKIWCKSHEPLDLFQFCSYHGCVGNSADFAGWRGCVRRFGFGRGERKGPAPLSRKSLKTEKQLSSESADHKMLRKGENGIEKIDIQFAGPSANSERQVL
jgi:hypothetical protein